MATQPVTKITEEEYLRRERAAEFRSEFVDGEVFEMPGGSGVHSLISGAFNAELRVRLRGRCLVYGPDLKVRTPRTGSYVYPDVSIVSGKAEFLASAKDILVNPRVVIEVLSPSTSNYDRGKKFDLYREIASLEEYLLCHQDSIRVEQFVRQGDDSWNIRNVQGAESSLTLASVGCTIRLGDVYDGIELDG